MSAPRAFLILLGLAFLVSGLVVAATFDRLTRLGFFVEGAFLFVLPFLAVHEE